MKETKTELIAETLRRRLVEGTYDSGVPFPSERDLTEEFAVSRVTVRNALERLEKEGLIVRSAGKGTHVVGSDGPRRTAGATTIALVSSQLTPSVASPIAAGCSAAALTHRAQLMLCDTGGTTFAEAQAKEVLHLRSIYEQGVPGVILWWQGGDASIPWLEKLLADGRAVVFVDRYLPDLPADFVGIDDEAAAYEAVSHLIRLGHQRIGCVVHSLRVTTSAGRLAGYRRALREHGLPEREEWVKVVEEGFSAIGPEVAMAFLGCSEPPTALLAVNDYVAIAVIDALLQRGVRVPEAVATVSFADMEVAEHYRVPLTTVRQPFRLLGESAVHLITERLQTRRTSPMQVILPTTLVVRRSCGASLRAPGEPEQRVRTGS